MFGTLRAHPDEHPLKQLHRLPLEQALGHEAVDLVGGASGWPVIEEAADGGSKFASEPPAELRSQGVKQRVIGGRYGTSEAGLPGPGWLPVGQVPRLLDQLL